MSLKYYIIKHQKAIKNQLDLHSYSHVKLSFTLLVFVEKITPNSTFTS